MKALNLLLVPVRLAAWVSVSGVFWSVFFKVNGAVWSNWLAVIALFFISYALMPRIKFMEKIS